MKRLRLSQSARLRIWMLASFAASIVGIFCAIYLGPACDGGRGGAVAVAISFGALFTARPLPRDLIEARDRSGKLTFDELAAEERTSRLRSALAVLLDRQSLETQYLAAASLSRTMMGGFGDWIAALFGAATC